MRALRYWGLLHACVGPSRPPERTKRQRPWPLIRAMLTSTRFTLPTASLPVLQSTSRERPDSWIRRRDAFRFRPLMLERGSFLPVEHSLPPGGLPPGGLPPGGLPPGGLPPGGLPPSPGWLPPGPGAAGIASSTGWPMLFWSSTACTLTTAPAGRVTFFENAPPPAVGLPRPRSTGWPSTLVTYFVAVPQKPS